MSVKLTRRMQHLAGSRSRPKARTRAVTVPCDVISEICGWQSFDSSRTSLLFAISRSMRAIFNPSSPILTSCVRASSVHSAGDPKLNPSTMSAQQDDRDGDLRARELFHYFQPDNPALVPMVQHTNRSCETPTVQKESPNLVLTALAQLAALKLGVQRCVIRYDFTLSRCFGGV